jgi:large conductance mechanosensitive channel
MDWGLIREFREFALKGNLLELAVAFVLGVAFAAVVTSLVDDVIMQVVAAIIGKPDFSNLTFSIGNGVIRYGSFLTALVTFLIIAWVLFLIVKAVQSALPAKEATKRDCPHCDCPHCLSSIPVGAGTCSFCTRDVQPAV